jgi:hypothetical protein
MEAHQACLNVSAALAATGARVLTDDEFFKQVNLIIILGAQLLLMKSYRFNMITRWRGKQGTCEIKKLLGSVRYRV